MDGLLMRLGLLPAGRLVPPTGRKLGWKRNDTARGSSPAGLRRKATRCDSAPRRVAAALLLASAVCLAAPVIAQSPEPPAARRSGAATSAETSAEPAAEIVSAPAAFPSLAPAASEETATEEATSGGSSQWSSPLITIASSLSVVLGLFAGLVWLTRRFGSKTGGGGALPQAALQALGSRAIDARTRIVMFRCGQRILVVAQTANGMHPLSEITDPGEVNQLTASCQNDSRHAFAQTIQSLEKEPAAPGFVGAESPPPDPRRRLFATG